jgi:hypothetical protein
MIKGSANASVQMKNSYRVYKGRKWKLFTVWENNGKTTSITDVIPQIRFTLLDNGQ